MHASDSPRSPAILVDRELGSGATSRVRLGVLVEDWNEFRRGTEVAVKEPREELAAEPAVRSAFRAEAGALSEVTHPNLVSFVYADGERIVTEYVSGRTLTEELAAGKPLAEQRVRSIGSQIAGALAALHAAGWRHGDLKPDNVRLRGDGTAVLLDLGFVARLEALEHAGRPGSLAYAAPETLQGDPPGAASDVYGLGVILYELATGAHPFLDLQEHDGENALETLTAARFTLPSLRVPQVTPLLDHLLAETLDRTPGGRPDARELENRLAQGEAHAWWKRHKGLVSGGLAFVGREAEMAEMQALAARAFEGGGVCWLEALTGGGKSRFFDEFALRVRGAARSGPNAPLVLRARCSGWMEERPAAPIVALLRRFLHLRHATPAGPRERAALAELLPDAEARALAAALDPEGEVEAPVTVPAALATFLLALAEAGPVVLFVDDVHFAGAGSLDVLARVTAGARDRPLFLVLGLRTDEFEREPGGLERLRERASQLAATGTVSLPPLDEEAVLALVESRFDASTPRLRLARALHERTLGVPALLAELFGELDSGGFTSVRDGRRSLTVAPDELPRPRSLHKAIRRRFGQLPAEERAWLERAAVAGGRIESEFLARAFPVASSPEVEEVLATLARKGWLVRGGRRYRFAHPAQREAIYRSIEGEARAALHASAAECLASESTPSLGVLFQRAFHLRAAGLDAVLLDLLPGLVRRVQSRGHPRRVRILATWGLEALDRSGARAAGERRLELLTAALEAADLLGDRAEQRRWLDELTRVEIDPDRDPGGAARVYWLHGRYAASTGRYGLARGWLSNAAQLFEIAGDTKYGRERGRVHCLLARIAARVGEFVVARAEAGRALALVQAAPDRAAARIVTGLVELLEDRLEPALATASRAMQELRGERRRTLSLEAEVQHLRARIYRGLGRPLRALAAATRARELARGAGDRPTEVEATVRIGTLLLDMDRERDAELVLREALLSAREVEDMRTEALASLFLAVLLAEAGRSGAAAELRRAAVLAREAGLAREEALVVTVEARLALERDDLLGALERTAEAMRIVEHVGAELVDRLVVGGTRALVLRQAGDGSRAAALERELSRRVRRENARIEDAVRRRRQRAFLRRLLRAALTREGPLFPRVSRPQRREGRD